MISEEKVKIMTELARYEKNMAEKTSISIDIRKRTMSGWKSLK